LEWKVIIQRNLEMNIFISWNMTSGRLLLAFQRKALLPSSVNKTQPVKETSWRRKE
jgi:hypothetical protein